MCRVLGAEADSTRWARDGSVTSGDTCGPEKVNWASLPQGLCLIEVASASRNWVLTVAFRPGDLSVARTPQPSLAVCLVSGAMGGATSVTITPQLSGALLSFTTVALGFRMCTHRPEIPLASSCKSLFAVADVFKWDFSSGPDQAGQWTPMPSSESWGCLVGETPVGPGPAPGTQAAHRVPPMGDRRDDVRREKQCWQIHRAPRRQAQ